VRRATNSSLLLLFDPIDHGVIEINEAVKPATITHQLAAKGVVYTAQWRAVS